MRKIALLFTLVLVAFLAGGLELMAQEPAAAAAAPSGGFQMLKEKFIEGGWQWMVPILFVLILGLAFCIERVITLNVATINTDKLLSKIDDRLQSNDIEGAIEVCKVTPGPTASTLLEGLRHAEKGPDAVEKAISAFGGMQ
ncbi:MAG TPA: hypothetical protein PKM27_06675, partial [Saprospiraceae bacterium]|nr:hypothetical protein [Saprospiraceae bacterium]